MAHERGDGSVEQSAVAGTRRTRASRRSTPSGCEGTHTEGRVMTHPNVEELAELLYEELDAKRRAIVLRHLESCEERRNRFAAWQGARGRLAAWELSGDRDRAGVAPAPAARRTSILQPVLKWAVAAAVLFGGG